MFHVGQAGAARLNTPDYFEELAHCHPFPHYTKQIWISQ
jgi:hypothetical protein